MDQTDLKTMRTLIQRHGWKEFMMTVGSLMAEQSDKLGDSDQGGALFASANTIHALGDIWSGCGTFVYPDGMTDCPPAGRGWE